MEYETYTTNDGCVLAYQTSLPRDGLSGPPRAVAASTCILLMHGFSGSSEYFTRNFDTLRAYGRWVVAPDMRGHGRSGRPRGGYHVARLAADLRELIGHLRKQEPTLSNVIPVGCSIGAAVLWTYVELFGCTDFTGLVFVDQAPLQDRALAFDNWDSSKHHTGCYDEASMLAAQDAWMNHPAETHKGLVHECLGYRYEPLESDAVSGEQAAKDQEFFTSISAQCDGRWLARLLADHTRYDHREAIEQINVPTLVMAGRRSGCFPLEGMMETVRRARKGERMEERVSVSEFESGHWLFYEEPERFNTEILGFVRKWTF